MRTFVSVVELGGHSKAGAMLGRSQPAVSLQLGRLEELVGAPLLIKKGRAIQPTADGEVLLTYAREVVRINDEAMSYFRRRVITGVLRIGLPSDYAVAFLQNALADFTRNHPEVNLEVHCDLSREILRRLRGDELDIIVAMMPAARMPYLSRSWIERPIWVAADSFVIDPDRPIPLVAHPEGCDYRARMIQSLETTGRRWRFVYTGPGISGLQNAVLNGLGVSALTRPTLLKGMRILNQSDGMAPLEPLRVGLFYKHPRQTEAGIKLIGELVANLDTINAGYQPAASG
ncbi:LysR substrate-binding domain-containing protein [Mesorhizobium sp. NBSH29]|uniref:LysR substrate-binding domain-containing protein n=1 Tax=Mesorhizobium sp. NBSH29 TaxID=2654249 RepID=UPI0021563721|nr:LysR substrate-binding domain-containing protein [Mesorhizobium sp. NBSH29]